VKKVLMHADSGSTEDTLQQFKREEVLLLARVDHKVRQEATFLDIK